MLFFCAIKLYHIFMFPISNIFEAIKILSNVFVCDIHIFSSSHSSPYSSFHTKIEVFQQKLKFFLIESSSQETNVVEAHDLWCVSRFQRWGENILYEKLIKNLCIKVQTNLHRVLRITLLALSHNIVFNFIYDEKNQCSIRKQSFEFTNKGEK